MNRYIDLDIYGAHLRGREVREDVVFRDEVPRARVQPAGQEDAKNLQKKHMIQLNEMRIQV